MALDLSPDGFRLDPVEDWVTGDSHTFAFTVTLEDGSAKDISNDSLKWALLERAYDDRSDAIVTESDSGVEIVTSGTVDPTAGEFEVRVDEDTVTDVWGRLSQRVAVDPIDDSQQTWIGEVLLTSA